MTLVLETDNRRVIARFIVHNRGSWTRTVNGVQGFFIVIWQRLHNLRVRLPAAFFLLTLIPMLAIGWQGYTFTSRVMVNQVLDSANYDVRVRAEQVVNSLSQVYADAIYAGNLRTVRALRTLNTDTSPEEYAIIQREADRDLLVLSAARPMYARIRYIDAAGDEALRVDFAGQTASIVPPDERRNIAESGIFQTARALEIGGIYVSSLTRSSRSEAPIFQYALNLEDGVMLVDVSAQWLMRGFEPANSAPHLWALADHSGQLLMFPESYDSTGTGAPTLTGVYPDAGSLLNGDFGTLQTNDHVLAYTTVYPVATDSEHYWVLFRDTPRSVLLADVDRFHTAELLYLSGFALVVVALALTVSRGIVAPLLDLQTLVERFAHNGAAPSRPDPMPKGEIGTLTDAFCTMAEELDEQRRKERSLLERLIHAQEEERKLVAYDLHDGLIQEMVGARFHLMNCRAKCPIDGARGDPESLKRSCDVLTHAIVEGRRIIQGLHPTVLDDLGLVDALDDVAHAAAEGGGWSLSLDLQPLPAEPERTVSVTLYRIVQEALNNVRKHAQASHVSITLRIVNDGLHATVRDNGHGFDINTINGGGLGVSTMRERASLLGGRWTVDSGPGRGTTIDVWIPCDSVRERTRDDTFSFAQPDIVTAGT